MAIKGQNLRLFVGGKCIAASTSCSYHVSAATESETSKDSGDWDENGVTGKSWDASADALVLLTDSSAETAVSMLALVGTEVTLVFDETQGDKNRVGKNSTIKHTGNAIVTDYSLTAGNRANATYSVSFTGNGPLS